MQLSFVGFVSEYDISKKLLLHLCFRCYGTKNDILEISFSFVILDLLDLYLKWFFPDTIDFLHTP